MVQYLISKGVPPQRLVAAGFGEFQPLDSDKTEEAFSRNRRIELKLTRAVSANPSVTCPAHASLRPYQRAADEDAAIELWQRTWQLAYPQIDFAARRRLVARALAQRTGADRDDHRRRSATAHMIGFVTVDPRTGYLDQIVVAPEAMGLRASRAALLDEAKRIVARRPRPARQHRQYPRHPLLREARLRASPARTSIARSGAPVYTR